MNIIISPIQARIIGCLIEKQATTPDQYPLSLNALTNACNQKSNREPVMELTEAEVQAAVDTLRKKYLVSDRSAGYGGRVVKAFSAARPDPYQAWVYPSNLGGNNP